MNYELFYRPTTRIELVTFHMDALLTELLRLISIVTFFVIQINKYYEP